MIPCLLLEAFLIFAAIVIRVEIQKLRPYVAPRFSHQDVIYYTGDELPRTEDLGGSQAGASGRAGGSEARHRTQTIKIARGSLTPEVVDAPNLKLPSSHDAVQNLLAINPNVGPPPADGLRSARTPISFTAPVVAPAPTIADEHRLVAPALGSRIIPPAPNIAREQMRNAPDLQSSVVAPAPSVSSADSRSAPALTSTVIAPAPNVGARDVSRSPMQAANVAVVPPPASAPERVNSRPAKLNLPAPVIAPPPSANVAEDTRRTAGSAIPDPSKAVVPPPPTRTGLGYTMDAGGVLAPPGGGGSGASAGLVVSTQPGPNLGLPANGSKGSTALSPSGRERAGFGGMGGGSSIGTGDGSGSGLKGEGLGAGKSGAGHGSDPSARGGISTSAGPGGAGNASGGNPAVPDVSVSGGSTIVTLRSPGSDSGPTTGSPSGGAIPQQSQQLNVTIVATASSGGAFEPYKNLLQGETYTTYVDTSDGQVVMEFALIANVTRP
jgi:hypothetical protein